MSRVHIDFETRSVLDIKKVGAWNYACHPSTEILCVAHTVPDYGDTIQLLDDICGDCPSCDKLAYLAADNTTIFVAHNAAFEQAIWENIMVARKGFPRILINRWRCTMAKAYSYSLPGKLEKVAIALDLKHKKDMAGNRTMLKLSKPRKQTANNSDTFWTPQTAPKDFEKLYKYCPEDVEVERELDARLPDLPPNEQRIWEIDCRANQRGLRVDLPLVKRAIEYSETYMEDVIERFRAATGNEVDEPSKRAQLLAWSARNGYQLINTQAATIKAVLRSEATPEVVRNALTVMAEAGKAALTKYPAFLARSDKQGVIRGALQYHGAHTGRWSGRGVQVQNLYRPTVKAKTALNVLHNFDFNTFAFLYEDIGSALSSLLRSAIVAHPGYDLYVGDYGQIESRLTAYHAGEDAKLALFRSGVDVYCRLASDICGYAVKPGMIERQWGKVGDLSLGFGGGINAYATMGLGYGVDFSGLVRLLETATYEELENSEYCYMLYRKSEPEEPVSREIGLACNIIKLRWRQQHPKTVEHWKDLETAAIAACQKPYPVVKCGKVKYFCHDVFLFCELPSGRLLAYPFPKVEVSARGKQTLTYRSEINGQWVRRTTWGGTLCENNVQAGDSDVIRFAMQNLEDSYPYLFNGHDELTCERKQNTGGSLDEFLNIMRRMPDWLEDTPMVVEGYCSTRYGK